MPAGGYRVPVVQRINVNMVMNCALCGKSVKFGTHVYHPKTCKFRTSAIAEFALGGRGSYFHIWFLRLQVIILMHFVVKS